MTIRNRTLDDNLVAVVGRRIRRLRVESGISLREQARALGMSPSALSELENARGGISLMRLQQVAGHFGLHVTDLLAEPAAAERPPVSIEIMRAAGSLPGVQRGRGVRYQLLGPAGGHSLQAALVSFEPGGDYAQDMLSHAGEEFVYVLYGSVELLLGDDVHTLAQGDAARYAANIPHAMRNASADGVAVVVGAATPPW